MKQGLLSEEEVAAVAGFHKIADAYDSPTDDYDHQAIVADPKWAEVAAAKRAQADLLKLIDDVGHPYGSAFILTRGSRVASQAEALAAEARTQSLTSASAG